MRRIISILMVLSVISLMTAAPGSTAEHMEQFVSRGEIGMIEYASGGVGKEEREAIEGIQGNYDLKLVFALDKGNYVSNVEVQVLDSTGGEILRQTSNGPWFLMNLPDGEYTISAVYEVEKQTRKVTVSEGKLEVIHFTWSAPDTREAEY